MKEQDEHLSQPNRADYASVFGYSYRYNKANALYKEKLNRDELRASISRIVSLENLLSKGMNCFVYNSTATVKVVENILPEMIFTVSATADPAVVFEKFDYRKSEATFSKLAKMVMSQDMASVTDYAVEVIKNATASQGIYVAFTDGNSLSQSLHITRAQAQGCTFGFSTNGQSLFVVMKDTKVFGYTFFEYKNINGTLSKGEVIDVGVASVDFTTDYVCYLKVEKDSNEGTLYFYLNGTKKQLIDSVLSFICFENGETLIFKDKKQNQSGLSADMYVYSDENCMLIDEKVDLHYLRYKNTKELAYIKNYDEAAGGDLYIYANGKSKLVARGANGILLF